MFKRIGVIIGCLLFSTLSAKEYETLKIVGAEFPPYYTNKSADYGLMGIILKKALEDKSTSLSFQVKPFARAIEETKQGKSDILAAVYKTPEREQYFSYTLPIIESDVVLIKHRSTQAQYKTLEDLTPYRIGKIRYSKSILTINNLQK